MYDYSHSTTRVREQPCPRPPTYGDVINIEHPVSVSLSLTSFIFFFFLFFFLHYFFYTFNGQYLTRYGSKHGDLSTLRYQYQKVIYFFLQSHIYSSKTKLQYKVPTGGHVRITLEIHESQCRNVIQPLAR